MTDPITHLLTEYRKDLRALVRQKNNRGLVFYRLYEQVSLKAQQLGNPGLAPLSVSSIQLMTANSVQIQAAAAACFAKKEADPDAQADLLLWGCVTIKTLAQFRAKLWAATNRLFAGGEDKNFVASFARSIDQQLTEAWNAGADSVGVALDEMTPDDMAVLEAIIANENQFILRLAGDVQADRDGGMKQEAFESKYGARVDLWANRYNEVVNRARIVFGSKLKFEWVEGPTEDKCGFCQALDGIVAFGYEWEEAGVHPQMPPNPTLTGEYNGKQGCQGWGCECELKPTKARRTARALDKITNIVMRARL